MNKDQTYATPDSPYERAVRAIEADSGQPRTEWEHVLRHPLVLQCNQLARELAGIPTRYQHPKYTHPRSPV